VARPPGTLLLSIALLAGALTCGPGCGKDRPVTFAPRPAGAVHRESVHAPAKLTSIEVDPTDRQSPRVACATCHALRPPKPLPERADQLAEFHRGLVFTHGDLACASCHVAGRPDALRLASGVVIPMTEALQLCGQCHGPQLRDFRRGAHGGVQGHWTLALGPRLRNHCVDCHDPHAPRVPGALPAPPPRDRGVTKEPHP
jgi:hypothetical protein